MWPQVSPPVTRPPGFKDLYEKLRNLGYNMSHEDLLNKTLYMGHRYLFYSTYSVLKSWSLSVWPDEVEWSRLDWLCWPPLREPGAPGSAGRASVLNQNFNWGNSRADIWESVTTVCDGRRNVEKIFLKVTYVQEVLSYTAISLQICTHFLYILTVCFSLREIFTFRRKIPGSTNGCQIQRCIPKWLLYSM